MDTKEAIKYIMSQKATPEGLCLLSFVKSLEQSRQTLTDRVHETEDALTGAIKEIVTLTEENKSLRCCSNCKYGLSMSQIGLSNNRPCNECINECKWIKG